MIDTTNNTKNLTPEDLLGVKSYFKKFERKGIAFMDDRQKGDIKSLVGETIHVDDFGFIKGRDGEYAVISTVEHPDKFYFAGLALTDIVRQVEEDGMRDALKSQGIKLSMKRSKNGRDYMNVEFVD